MSYGDVPMKLNLRRLIRVEPDLDQDEARFRRACEREFSDAAGAKFVDIVFYLNELRASNGWSCVGYLRLREWVRYPADIESLEGEA